MKNTAIIAHESQVASYNRAFPFVIKKAVGSTITDTNDTDYIDFFSGAGANNYGHNHPLLKQALLEYITSDGINNSLDMASVAKKQFVEVFYDHVMEPRGLGEHVLQFTGPTGTNAVEAALKLVRNYTGRSNVIAFRQGFHGVSLGSLETTSNPYFRDAAGVSLGNVSFIEYDTPELEVEEAVSRLNSQIAELASQDPLPAAVIVEAIQGEGGVNAARPEWLQALREATQKHDMLLIIDDIQAGCGRSGHFFGFEEAGITPDIITLSKSISGFGSPMSLVLLHKDIDIWKPAQHNGTFRGNNHAFVTATKAVEVFWRTDALANDVREKAKFMRQRLDEITVDFPALGLVVKGRGFLQGLAFKDPLVAARVSAAAFENGLIIERAGPEDEVVKFMPALTIDQPTLERGLAIVADCIKAVASNE